MAALLLPAADLKVASGISQCNKQHGVRNNEWLSSIPFYSPNTDGYIPSQLPLVLSCFLSMLAGSIPRMHGRGRSKPLW